MVPTDQPLAGLDLLHRFLSGQSWTDFPSQGDEFAVLMKSRLHVLTARVVDRDIFVLGAWARGSTGSWGLF